MISAGFKHIDAVSFVSPTAVPQMADSEEVGKELDPPDDVEIIGIVVNEKGAQRAINTNGGAHAGISVFGVADLLAEQSAPDARRGHRQLEKIKDKGEDAGLDTVVYISMAFGNPYGDQWNVDEVVDAVELLESYGVRMISLAERLAMAEPAQIGEVVSAVIAKYDYLEIGVHLHSRPDQAAAKVTAAYDAGCRRFDSALGGPGWMSLRSGCAGRQHSDRAGANGIGCSWRDTAIAEISRCIVAGDGGDWCPVFHFSGGRLIYGL